MKNFTRIVLMCVVLCVGWKEINAQYVTIPDPNFRTWLNNNGYAGCMNGMQMDTTCSAVVNATILDCHGANIVNLTGIGYFDNITTLDCSFNQLGSLGGVLPRWLTKINCSFNGLSGLPPLPSSLKCSS